MKNEKIIKESINKRNYIKWAQIRRQNYKVTTTGLPTYRYLVHHHSLLVLGVEQYSKSTTITEKNNKNISIDDSYHRNEKIPA